MFINEGEESQDTQTSIPKRKIDACSSKTYELEEKNESPEIKSRINKSVNKHFRIKQNL